jgi:hypothetical protein
MATSFQSADQPTNIRAAVYGQTYNPTTVDHTNEDITASTIELWNEIVSQSNGLQITIILTFVTRATTRATTIADTSEEGKVSDAPSGEHVDCKEAVLPERASNSASHTTAQSFTSPIALNVAAITREIWFISSTISSPYHSHGLMALSPALLAALLHICVTHTINS